MSESPRSLRRVKRRFALLEASSGCQTEVASIGAPLCKKRNLSLLLGGSKDSNRAPEEGPQKLLEGAQTGTTEPPCHMGQGSTEKTSLVPTIEGAGTKNGSPPPHGLASTSSRKNTTTPY